MNVSTKHELIIYKLLIPLISSYFFYLTTTVPNIIPLKTESFWSIFIILFIIHLRFNLILLWEPDYV